MEERKISHSGWLDGKKRVRIRQTQLLLQKVTLEDGKGRFCLAEGGIRIGDLVALMICAQYMRHFENHHITFQLLDRTHINLKADILFKNALDEIVINEGEDFGLGDPTALEIYDPGPLWIASTFYHNRHGAKVMPTLNLDSSCYTGPAMDWGNYVVFHPLFDPPYNEARGMSESFVNELCNALGSVLGHRLYVVTDRPERIHANVQKVVSTNLYDLVYIIAQAKVFVGGDTGFTHMAAAGRVPNLFALYGKHYSCDFGNAFAELCFDETLNPFSAWGKYWGTGMDIRPKHDCDQTNLRLQILENNSLSNEAMDSLVQEICRALGAQ